MESTESKESRAERDARVREGIEIMRRIIRKRLGVGAHESDVAGIANRAWCEFQRARDRGLDLPEVAMMVTIAKRRAINHLKRVLVPLKEREVLVDPTSNRTESGGRAGGLDLTQVADESESDISRRERQEEARALLGILVRYVGLKCQQMFAALVLSDMDRQLAAEIVGVAKANSFNVSFKRCAARAREVLASDGGPMGEDWRRYGAER